MSFLKFLSGMGVTILVSGALFSALKWTVSDPSLTATFSYSLFFFILFTAILFPLSRMAIRHPNHNTYSGLIIISILFKLVLSVGLVFWMRRHLGLSDPIQIIPFIINYILFTIFEVYFMSIIAQRQIYKL